MTSWMSGFRSPIFFTPAQWKGAEMARVTFLDAIRQAVASDVDRTWTSPWKSPETVDAKLRARLAGHREYQALRVRQRELGEQRRSLTTEIEKGSAP